MLENPDKKIPTERSSASATLPRTIGQNINESCYELDQWLAKWENIMEAKAVAIDIHNIVRAGFAMVKSNPERLHAYDCTVEDIALATDRAFGNIRASTIPLVSNNGRRK